MSLFLLAAVGAYYTIRILRKNQYNFLIDRRSVIQGSIVAIKVDKEKKRNAIACSCKDILLEHGIKDLTISQIADTANVGKGTIYEYFKNKEDIVFEIITVFIAEYEQRLLSMAQEDISTKEKLFHFFFMIHGDEEGEKQLSIYREFLAIAMTQGTEEMTAFNVKCRAVFSDILGQIMDKGIENGEIDETFLSMKSALLTFKLGLVVEMYTADLDPKEEVRQFLDALFTLSQNKENR